MLNLAGSQVDACTAKIFTVGMRDLCYCVIGKMSVLNEHTIFLGHILVENELSFSDVIVEDFATTQACSMFLAGSHLQSREIAKSWVYIIPSSMIHKG